ncbi:MAG TPA: nuclear transport factor 2 family protein [Kofleriaceae bacterium]|nr:nuclear transport factor 2 family protein [Kofleriaceae bacterium]
MAVAVVAACGGGGAKPAPTVVEPAVEGKKAETDARGLVREIYDTINRGKPDSLFSLLTDPIVVFGPRRADAMASRSDALVALGKAVDPKAPRGAKKKHVALRSSGLEVVASGGGHSAWAFDIVSFEGQSLAVTAVLSNTSDLWAVTAAAIAAMPTVRQVKAESARDAIVPPGATAVARIDPGAEPAVERFRKGLLDQQSWGDDLSSRDDAVAVGPVAGEVARGKNAIKRQWKARLRSNLREAASGEITAARTADGQLVWISAPVTRVADGEDPLPLRVFAVYEKEAGGWKLAALHEALAIDEPGSGAAFKKIVPPAPAPPEPPKAEPAADKPASDAPARKKKPRRGKKS